MKKRFQKVYIEITNRCNLNCKFCPKTIREYQNMSLDKFKYVLSQVKEYTNLIYLHVKGEPLIHPEFSGIIDSCSSSEMLVNLTTNGTMLKQNLPVLMNARCIRQINISIHSAFENSNDENKIREYLSQTFACAHKLSKNIIISYRLWNMNDIKENEHNKIAFELLEKEYNIPDLSIIAKENKSIKLADNIYLNQDIEFKWPNIKENQISKCGTCLGLKNQIAILVNGDVVPCCLDENGDILLGNIFEEDLQSIISSDKSKNIISGFNNNRLEEKLCQTCGFRTRFDK